MIRPTETQRWWKLATQLQQDELRQDAGRYDIIRRWVEARTAPQIPRLLFLKPRAVGGAEAVGPACEACGEGLGDDQHLAACTVCLTVFHRDCLDRPDACALLACQEEWF